MGNAARSTAKKRINGEICRHYWLIETPDGATCKGKCRFCGEEKEFISSFDRLMSMGAERKPVQNNGSGVDEYQLSTEK